MTESIPRTIPTTRAHAKYSHDTHQSATINHALRHLLSLSPWLGSHSTLTFLEHHAWNPHEHNIHVSNAWNGPSETDSPLTARPVHSPNLSRPSAPHGHCAYSVTATPRQLERLQTMQWFRRVRRVTPRNSRAGLEDEWLRQVGVPIRTGQGWSSRVERGRDQVCGLARYLQGAHRSLCAPLVRSSSYSQLEHIDLEPEPVEKTEMRRRSSRRSHHLRSKRARRIAVREPNAAARSVGARRAVTSAVRGEGAHMLEQISHVLRWYPSRPSRSSAAGRVAPDHTFRATETPGGSHGGPRSNLLHLPARLHDHSDHFSRACAMNLHTNDPVVLPGGSLGDSTMTQAHRRCDCCSRRPRTTGSSTSRSRHPSR